MKAGPMAKNMAEKWDLQSVVDWDAYLVQLTGVMKAVMMAEKMAGMWVADSVVETLVVY